MRRIAFAVGLVLAASIAGCVTTSMDKYEEGQDFRVEDTKQLIVGKTTSAEVLKLFGEPYSKSMTGVTEEDMYRGEPVPLWIYLHMYGTQTDQTSFDGRPISTRRKGWWKQLMIVFQNGIVTSYKVFDGPEGGGTR
jgi:hypothetical protein